MTAVTAESGLPALPSWAPAVARWVLAILGAVVVFGIVLAIEGANPFTAYGDMLKLTFQQQLSLEQIAIRMSPLILGALAVAVPARAGLTNVGGEGQIIIGAVASCGAARVLSDSAPGSVVIVGMFVASMLAGAIWAGIAAAMRLVIGVNEAITTLLLNFVAVDVLGYLIYGSWREDSAGQPTTKALAGPASLPLIGTTKVHIGIIFALVAVVVVWFLLNKTRWGFAVSVAGGNAEAARRAGMKVALLVLSALVIGGALAGLGGMVQYAGVEFKLRPGFGTQLGYTAFLACWLARHKPFPIVLAGFVFAALAVGSDSLQLDSQLPAASINILTALILIAVLGFTTSRKKAAS